MTTTALAKLHALGTPDPDLRSLIEDLVDDDPVQVRQGASAALADVVAVLRLCAAEGPRRPGCGVDRDRRAGRYCRPIDTHHLAVAPENEATFRAAAPAAGYPLPPATP